MLVTIRNAIDNSVEWGIIEFQGEIVGELEGKTLGKLEILENGRVEMEIGQQFLEGSVVSLKSPLLVITEVDGQAAEPGIGSVGVVRKKILFNSRPKPSNTAKRLRI